MSEANDSPAVDKRATELASSNAQSGTPTWIVDASATNFEAEVFERSKTVPVVLDFWAAWCQPCQMLKPILESLAREYEGRFVLVKADVDQVPELANQFGVSSIPVVFALRDGEPIDQFAGVMPEEAVREWIDRILPTEADMLVSEARNLEAAAPGEAEQAYRKAAELDPRLPAAQIGLARVLLALGRDDESREVIDGLRARGYLEEEAKTLDAQLALSAAGSHAGSVEACRAKLAESPDDKQLQLELAEAYAAAGQHEESLEACLSLVATDRQATGEDARKLMLNLFQTLGNDDPLTTTYRRKLSTALY